MSFQQYTISIIAIAALLSCLSANYGGCEKHATTICVGTSTKDYNCTYFQDNLEFLSSLSNKTDETITVLLLIQHITVTKSHQLSQLNGFKLKGGLSTTHTIIECSRDSGLLFTGITNMIINNIVFKKCGGMFNSTSKDTNGTFTITAGVYMSNCTNINISDTVLDQSPGNGMVLYDCTGDILISNTNFTNNQVFDQTNEAGGGGLYIEFTECSPEWSGTSCDKQNNLFNSNANYNIHQCTFINNTRIRNKVLYTPDNLNDHRGAIHGGGGLSLWARGYSRNNTVLITDSIFIANKATYGGGLYFSFSQAAYDHRLLVINSTFKDNMAFRKGGALDTGTISISPSAPYPDNVTVFVYGCDFIQNQAEFGGGTGIFASLPYRVSLLLQIEFKRCIWQGNLAQFGFAINLRSVFAYNFNFFPPKVTLSECIFKDNEPTNSRSNTGLAAVHTRSFPITLDRNVQFISNKGSGIKLVDSILTVTYDTNLLFMNNNANSGGGISLIGFSSILVQSNVRINFTDNYANFQGGAIYSYSIDEQPQGICFLQHQTPKSSTAATFTIPELYFNGNMAANETNSIFVSSTQSCSAVCYRSNITVTNLFRDCIGKFYFDDQSNIELQIQTEGSRLVIDNSLIPLKCIPGMHTLLPILVLNELGAQTTESFYISITGNGRLELVRHFTANSEIQVNGEPGQTGILQMNSLNFRNLSTAINITLTECPPGFVIDRQKCICCTLKDESHYVGIAHCDVSNNETFAFIKYGYWIGYLPGVNESEGENNLYTSICPQGYCSYEYNPYDNLGLRLPSMASQKQLNEVICNSCNRKGILCGECIDNHSVYFHSSGFTCKHNKYCIYGVPFYLLSEIVPVTCMFSVVVLAGFNFNSGRLNGFILFAQLLPSLAVTANGAIVNTKTESILKDISTIIYGPFNLNFFKIDFLSFCLFKGANFFMITIMEIFTLVYSLVLVVILVFMTRSGCCYKLQIACFRRGITKTASLTNGLAAFLIICYSQTTRLCFQILNVGKLDGKGEKIEYSHRVFHMGSTEYFTGVHIPFCIGAILILITVVAIPPLFLLAYPLVYKIFPQRFQKSKQIRFILHKIEKYHPLFDAFQGCFQDKHRYFAGIHFLYRSIFATTYAFISSRLTFYITNQLLATVILFVHLTVQPYKQRVHNLLDGMIFTLLLIINMLTLWRYVLSMYQYRSDGLFATGIIQLLLLLLPAIVVIIYILYKALALRLSKYKGKQELHEMTSVDSSFLEDLDLKYSEYSGKTVNSSINIYADNI